MTTKEDLRSNALNDGQSQTCRRRLILWSDCESKMSAAKSKDRIKEIIDNLKKETKWVPNVRFSRNDQSKPSCAKESEKLMKQGKLLEYPYWKCCISDGSNLLELSILQTKIDEYFNTCPDCKIPTIMVMVPSSGDDFRDAVEYLTGEKFDSKRSNEPPFVALLQHRNQSKNDIPDWPKVRSLTTGHWELVKCFPEVEGKGGNAGTREKLKRGFESFTEGEDPGTHTGNLGKEGRRYLTRNKDSAARTGNHGTPTKEVGAPPAPAVTPPQSSEKKSGPIKRAKTIKYLR